MTHFFKKLKFDYREYIPKCVLCFQEGYTSSIFSKDLVAGLTVGVITVPLAMAYSIGAGLSPDRGLFTAIIAGFIISLLGGSRVQIGGPVGAYVIIIYTIVQKYGYDGLAVATFIAGILIILLGLMRAGVLLKFIPYPVTTGFTTGIAVNIFSSQIKDFFGLKIDQVPPAFIEKWTLYCKHAFTCNPWSVIVATGTLITIFALRRWWPRLPGVIIAIILATAITQLFQLPIETVETKFGMIPRSLPIPSLPSFSWAQVKQVFPDAVTIALLGAIESLLSAMVADGMTGHRHRSNCELVAQGLANLGSVCFGGIPATGAIARTSVNIKLGAKTPVAGMIHAVTVLLLLLFLAPAASMIPLSGLAAILIFVAWNMSELDHFYEILTSQFSDAAVLVTTFLLTVLVGLTVAVQVGVVLAAVLFLKKMTDTTTVEASHLVVVQDAHERPEIHDGDILFHDDIPKDVTIFEIKGPFFFAVSDLLSESLRLLEEKPRVYILRMQKVPLIDTTGLQALKKFAKKCHDQKIIFCISGLKDNLKEMIKKAGIEQKVGADHFFPNINAALTFAKVDFSK